MSKKNTLCTIILLLLLAGHLSAQFSPGELSRVHEQLEGIKNCLQCHETGKEISGRKCLACHQEINTMMDAKRGYPFAVRAQQCVTCHKEHLGRDAQTVLFDKTTFNHSLTGFERTGKHATIRCEECHAPNNIRDPLVQKIVKETGRQTYLGLGSQCVDCHADRHNATVGNECQRCHSTTAWSPATLFNHEKTSFSLRGKHATVPCSKCHSEMTQKEKGKPLVFKANAGDCSSCHSSPHSIEFLRSQSCNSCHIEENWRTLRATNRFDHDLTSFRLLGKHASVACEKCHKPAAAPRAGRLKLAHNACNNCHMDYHRGEIAAAARGQCESCHTPFGFSPATYTLSSHSASRFPLTGAHIATPCEKCHASEPGGRKSFRFADLRCESCHKDVHRGQFKPEMVDKSCAACHTTKDWFPSGFDHSRTQFTLAGKHAQLKCSACHKPVNVGGVDLAQYKKTPTRCESCHREPHRNQFMIDNETRCSRCHQETAWQALVFDHNTMSAFPLTGAHTKAECRQCHREERNDATTFVRYKPLSTKCESCHTREDVRND